MKKMKKLMGIFAALVLAFAVVSCSNGSGDDNQNNGQQQQQTPVTPEATPSTKVELTSLDNVYSFDYTFDYGLEDLIEAGLSTEDELTEYLTNNIPSWMQANANGANLSINIEGIGCCSIVADNAGSAGGKIFGRNFDYDYGTAVIIHTKREGSYESVSTSYPKFITHHKTWTPVENPTTEDEIYNNAIIIGAIYVPMDGMNEKGFYISILEAGDNETTAQTAAGKTNIQTTVAARYLLDKADSVEKALELLEGFNMYSVHGTAYHFAMADNTGKSVVVEWINNNMIVIENVKVVTNHYLAKNSGKTAPAETDNSIVRYNAAFNAGELAEWNMNHYQMRDALKAAKAIRDDPNSKLCSIWSSVYEPAANKIYYYFREDYTKYVEVSVKASN